MPQFILSLNAGSSSLKCSLYQISKGKTLEWLGSAEVSSVNQPPSKLKYVRGLSKQESQLDDIDNHRQAFEHVLNAFLFDKDIEVSSKEDIKYACHRVVQGGDFEEDQLITKETFHKIEALSDLAPLHNASAVQLMIACQDHLPRVINVACFDSAFHRTMPDYVKTYVIDQKVAKERGLRKYGFHGLSYSYILRIISKFIDKPPERTSLIALHLGSGASACAIKDGQSIDTTMGLTPVSGLPGGTRSGDIDPSLVFHYTSDASKLSPSSTRDLHISTAEEILNKQSGWKALTGTTNFGEIARPDAPDSHRLAFNIFVDRLVGYIGNYYVKLGGQVDAIVFTGGIGQNSVYLRQVVLEKCRCLGFTLDENKNHNPARGSVVDIGKGGKPRSLVCETDEDVGP
ncbi:hypothetical protein DV737_g2482, partial [Chaetothyriales sp. CBS 132003]